MGLNTSFSRHLKIKYLWTFAIDNYIRIQMSTYFNVNLVSFICINSHLHLLDRSYICVTSLISHVVCWRWCLSSVVKHMFLLPLVSLVLSITSVLNCHLVVAYIFWCWNNCTNMDVNIFIIPYLIKHDKISWNDITLAKLILISISTVRYWFQMCFHSLLQNLSKKRLTHKKRKK